MLYEHVCVRRGTDIGAINCSLWMLASSCLGLVHLVSLFDMEFLCHANKAGHMCMFHTLMSNAPQSADGWILELCCFGTAQNTFYLTKVAIARWNDLGF